MVGEARRPTRAGRRRSNSSPGHSQAPSTVAVRQLWKDLRAVVCTRAPKEKSRVPRVKLSGTSDRVGRAPFNDRALTTGKSLKAMSTAATRRNSAPFVQRHIGPNQADTQEILSYLGYESTAALADDALPKSIRQALSLIHI